MAWGAVVKLFLICPLLCLLVVGVHYTGILIHNVQHSQDYHPHPQTAGWYFQRPCGLPGGMFDNLKLDVEQTQQAYAASALNLTTYAKQLSADATAAKDCQPMVMHPDDRKMYVQAISEAATAGALGKTEPYAMGSHLDASASLLALVSNRTGK